MSLGTVTSHGLTNSETYVSWRTSPTALSTLPSHVSDHFSAASQTHEENLKTESAVLLFVVLRCV